MVFFFSRESEKEQKIERILYWLLHSFCWVWESVSIERFCFKEAIESASTLAEVDHLQSILQGGRIPEKGWNLPVSAPSSNAEKG